ncbi:SH3 domain-containing protein [Pseudomonas sp. Irchel s3a18]|uniref:SH3 domain-containing protein n=1 Tax=Pseudomonas sp. Irchel s3a18 TaxID=2009053 RepID=UPI000BA39D77|nr:SH3 domain-containing protein [Pseudomonas sp. Irchel s3a18]
MASKREEDVEQKMLVEKGNSTKGLLEESTMDAIRAFRSSPTIEAILAFQNSPAMQAVLAFQNTPAMNAIRAIENLPSIGRIQALQNSSAMRVIQALQNLPTIKLDELLKVSPIHEYLQKLNSVAEPLNSFRTAARALESSQPSPLAEFFASERSAEIPALVEASGDAAISIAVSGDFRVATAAELELERQIVGHLEQGKPASALSTEQNSRLILVLSLLLLIVAFIEKESAVRQELCFFLPKMAPSMTSGEVGEAVRSYMCEKDIPEEFLKRYHTVKGTGVKLRAGPGMNEEVLSVNLPDRAALEILDSRNRNWLHVAVVGEDGVDGWISRKYTHQLSK